MKDTVGFVLKIVGVCLMLAAVICLMVAYKKKIFACCSRTKAVLTRKIVPSEYDDYADVK
ncbi:hypothetical protein [Papillibacter cinnamivorans]|uniref:Uncharacterized protein n=1 Tax=Papillibacter cinnamivorans DSM 12816 TaxID=1122930 RepID=A0A1W2A4M1_9FIRM|nr:hypothetical protein [Papillibacter cinnamivorans]SMC55422.1 hypothetical protein SAMN02745168_1464 [Papillibacter cinnamivorans DSM 12816]